MKKLFILVFLIIFILSNIASAESFRGRSKSMYESTVASKVTDEVAQAIKTNSDRFTLLDPNKKGIRFVKASDLENDEIKKLLMYEVNRNTLVSALSYLKTKRFSSTVEREIVGKIYKSRAFIRNQNGMGGYDAEEKKLTTNQLEKILKKCARNVNGVYKGVFYDPITKKNLQFERFKFEQLLDLVKVGPRQHSCILRAAA